VAAAMVGEANCLKGGNRPMARGSGHCVASHAMNRKLAENTLRAGYKSQCAQYRKDDEIEVTSAHHQRIHGILRDVSRSFDRPIRVLEAGCGTGRYFHCLENVEQLVGLDLSPEMLESARDP